MRTTAALFTILSTPAILSVPFAQARNDHNDHSFGQISRTSISVIVERNLKVGNFTVSFSDLNIPVADVPMEVIRTYDSRDKRVGDFGFGWTLGLRNIRVEKSGVLGFKWFETVSQEVFPNYCLEATGSHVVTVTFPGGKVFKFQAAVTPHCQRFAPVTAGTLSFTPMPGTHGTLEIVGSADFQVDGSVPGPVNLISFEYDERGHVLRKTDARGGVTTFTYDANDNVLTETNALGKTTTYTYDTSDHRTSVTDPLNNVTQFNYSALGKVLTTTDPLNHVTTNTYNPAGNLVTTKDALNNLTSFTYSIFDGQQTSMTDALNNTTSYTYIGPALRITEIILKLLPITDLQVGCG